MAIPHLKLQHPLDILDQTIQATRALNWLLFRTLEKGDDLSRDSDGIHTLFDTQADILDSVARELEQRKAMDTATGDKPSVQEAAAKLAAMMGEQHGGTWYAEVDHEGPLVLIAREAGESKAVGRPLSVEEMDRRISSAEKSLGEAIKPRVRFSADIDDEEKARLARHDDEQADLDRLTRQSARMDAPLAGAPMTAADLRDKFIADNVRQGVGPAEIAAALNMKQAAVDKLISQMTPNNGSA